MSIFSIGGTTPSDGFELKSARFNDDDSAYLSRTPGSAGNRKTWTWSGWVKRGTLGSEQTFFMAHEGGNDYVAFQFDSDDTLNITYKDLNASGGSLSAQTRRKITSQVFRDPSAWYHIVIKFEAASTNCDVYVNGEEVTAFSVNEEPQDLGFAVNNNVEHVVGSSKWSVTGVAISYFDGYIAEVYLIDGTALTPSTFGETNELTNQWQPKEPKDIKAAVYFGLNGFYLPFSNDDLATSFTDISPLTTSDLTFTPTSGALTCDVLIVGGGGAGGGRSGLPGIGGGGGAGGFRALTGITVSSATAIAVGFGGPGQTDNNITPNSGGTSGFGDYLAGGGGGGGCGAGCGGIPASTDGGGGGGGGGAVGANDYGEGGAYGFNGGGGQGASGSVAGGGGGGSSAVGNQGVGTPTNRGGTGGNGTNNDFRTGSNVTYAGGGGGAGREGGGGAGGTGGGGPGGQHQGSNTPPTAGGTNTGGGGGGKGGTGAGADGGTGIVVIRYLAATAQATGGTITTYGSGASQYQVHSFTTPNTRGIHTITPYGTAKNERISNHPVTANGNAHIIGPKVGSSAIAFDGTGDYLSVPQSADFAPGTSDFTIEGWVYPISGSYSVILTDTCDQAASPPRAGIRFWVALNGIIEFYASTVNSSTDTINYNSPAGAVELYKWQHLAAVRDGNTFRAYVDGVQVSTLTISATSNSIPAPGPLFMGRQTTIYARMNVDEYRFSNTCRYPNGTTFAPPTSEFTSDANTKLLIHSNAAMGNTTFTDSSSAGHTITANGVVKHVAPKIGTGMAVFDGSGDYLSVGNPNNDFGFGTEDFTVEMWVLFNAAPTTEFGLICNHDYGVGGWQLTYDGDGDDYFHLWSSDQSDYDLTSAMTPSANTWYHYAVTRQDDTLRFYIDGVQQTSQAFTENMTNTAVPLMVGTYADSGQGAMPASYVDGVRVSKLCRYPDGTTFTPSTTAFKDDIDTVLLLHMDGGGGIDPTTNLPTLTGQGTYFWDASTNALFYGADGLPTNKSIISFDGSGDYLTASAGSDWNFGTDDFTVEFWANGNGNSVRRESFTLGAASNNINFDFNEGTYALWAYWGSAGSGNASQRIMSPNNTGGGYTDGKWRHFALVRNGTTVTLYVNGTSIGSQTGYSSSLDCSGSVVQIGYMISSGVADWLGYMDEIRISNSARYTANFTPSTTRFTSDANTKLLVQSNFSEGGLGADHSGNYNYFTPSNIGANDSMPDSPMNNFCTWNPLRNIIQTGWTTFSEGNLKAVTPATGGSSNGFTEATMGIPSSGKWYWETLCKVGGYQAVGIGAPNATGTYMGQSGSRGYYSSNGNTVGPGGGSYGSSYTVGDIIGCAVDMDNGAIYWAKNNTWQDSGDPTSGASKTGAGFTDLLTASDLSLGILPAMSDLDNAETATVIANFGQDSSFASEKTAQGNQDGNDKGDFYFTPPTGYLALCTDNLPTPSIALPGENFNTKLYTGTGAELAVTDVGFQPDFTWIKTRELAYNHRVFDVVRGVTKELYTNANNAEVTDAQSLKSFDSDGFTLGTSSGVNPSSSSNMVSWNWKAGGAPTVDNSAAAGATPTAGSVKINGSNLGSALAGSRAATRLSANTTAGFSIVEFVGDTTVQTIAHGLSQKPEMIIEKAMGGSQHWLTGHDGLNGGSSPWDYYVYLSLTSADSASTNAWNDTAPTSSVFTIGSGLTTGGNSPYIAYCFHSVDGYSKIGSYTGNGNTDGTFIYTGFEPAFVITKRTDSSGDWVLLDVKRNTYNEMTYQLMPNANYAEGASASSGTYRSWTTKLDMVSNGFKHRWAGDAGISVNVSSGKYLYIAFAESPFKTSNAR